MDEFDPDVGKRPQVEAPTVATLMRKISARPGWESDEPLHVDEETFVKARAEMTEIQKRQGRPLAVAPWIKDENFLLRGVAVVME
jgi:hypothetical protein